MNERQPLAVKHHPANLDDVAGQEAAVEELRTLQARGGLAGRAYWLAGKSGTGKTTLARWIAEQVADQYSTRECTGRELTAKMVRDMHNASHCKSLFGDDGKNGRAYIVNEAHGISTPVMEELLQVLDMLPGHVVWIFTTTLAGQQSLFDDKADTKPLLSRCQELTMTGDAEALAKRARHIAQAEGIDGLPLSVYTAVLGNCDGNLRRLLQRIESGAFRRDAKGLLTRDLEAISSTKGEYADKRRASLQAALAKLA